MPELERVRRGDAEQLALEQPPLDLAPLRGRVAGAVGRERRVVPEPVGGEAVDQLGRAPALGEAERAQAARDEVGQQPRRLAERARSQAELLVGQRRVPERDRPLGARRAVVADHRRLRADQRARQLARVGDRGRGEQELRLGAVDARQPPQPAQDVRDVRAEDAAVDVRLVHDHVREVREHVAPAVVVREHADVEHVRVGQDQVRPLAHLPAALRLGVAVVDRGAQPRRAERAERPELVLRERLRRVEVERPLLRLARERVEDGQVEREGLPARGARRDDQVLAARGRLPRLGLVRVERLDARAPRERAGAAPPEAAPFAPRARAPTRGARAPRPGASRPRGQRLWPLDDGSLAAPGCPAGLRSHPTNLIRVMPAEGADGSTRFDDCRVRLRRRRRDPGRPEGVRRGGLPRHERDRRADRAEHDRRRRRPRGAAGVRHALSSRPCSTTSASTRPRRGCSSRRRRSRRSPTFSPSTRCRSWSTR